MTTYFTFIKYKYTQAPVMLQKMGLTGLLFCMPMQCLAAKLQQENLPGVATSDVINWVVGLCLVLVLFFMCMLLVRRSSRFTVTGAGKLSVLGGLSLGMREKVILLQVGKKQLLLGVTPGKINTLHVLEGEDCLTNDLAKTSLQATNFAEKLQQMMKGSIDASS